MNITWRILAIVTLLLALTTYGMADVVVPPALLDEEHDAFLSQLVRYLEAVSDFSNSDLEIEPAGKLPAITMNDAVDFYLTEEKAGSFSVLYRAKGVASYRRAAVNVTQIARQPDNRTAGQEQGEVPNSSADDANAYRIKKGERVTISFVSGAIRLDVEGQAMEYGAGHGPIRVRVVETGKEFIGTVAGPREVRVDL